MAAEYEVLVYSAGGAKVGQFTSFEGLSYSQRVNEVGMLEFQLRGDHAAVALPMALNGEVVVQRGNAAMGLSKAADFAGLLRYWKPSRTDRTIWLGRAYTLHSLLGRRCVQWAEGTANRTDFTAVKGETIMKTLVSYNAAASATVVNGRKRAGAITGLTVEADGAHGSTVDWYCARGNLLETLQQLALIAGGDFDVIRTAAGAYQFRWYTGQRGTDRTATVKFSTQLGNMGNPAMSFDHTDEATAAVVWGAGEGSARATAVRTSADYAAGNDIEIAVEASGAVTLNDAGDAALAEKKKVHTFEFEVIQTPGCYYGVHYFLGDLVSAQWGGTTYTLRVRGATITLDEGGQEQIDVEMVRT